MIWLNGHQTGSASVSVQDRGYLLGDGLFETLLAVEGRPVFLDLHLDRLYQSLPVLAMPARYPRHEISAAIEAVAANANASSATSRSVIRVTVTRTGGRGLEMSESAEHQNWLISGAAIGTPPDEMSLSVVETCRPSTAATSRLKSVNYLDNILARRRAVQEGADEALLLNEHGRLSCAAAANIYLIQEGEILTPPVCEGALPGTRRARLLSLEQQIYEQTGLRLSEIPLTRQDLVACRSAFVTNSLMGAVPVVRIDDHAKEKSPAMQAISSLLQAD